MQLSAANIVDIYLTRSPTEKAFVIATSVVFLFLSVVLAFSLLSSNSGLKTTDELLGIGGYLVAAAGFREVRGISQQGFRSLRYLRHLFQPHALSFGVAVSFFRGRGVPSRN